MPRRFQRAAELRDHGWAVYSLARSKRARRLVGAGAGRMVHHVSSSAPPTFCFRFLP